MAAHAIKAGEGDAFVVRRRRDGVAVPVRRGRHRPAQPAVRAGAEERSRERTNGASSWEPPSGLPDIYIAMGQTAENVRLAENVGRQEMDEFAALSQQRAVESQKNGFFEREIIPVDAARRHGRVEGRRSACRARRSRSWRS